MHDSTAALAAGKPAELRLLGPWWETPQPYQRRLSHQFWVVRDRVGLAAYSVLSAIADCVATRRMRERAWAEGFGVALGCRQRTWLDRLEEWHQGNEVAEDLAYAAHGMSVRFRPFVLPPL
jgi:hypothetical protein